jgi:hypothetical protein
MPVILMICSECGHEWQTDDKAEPCDWCGSNITEILSEDQWIGWQEEWLEWSKTAATPPSLIGWDGGRE